MATVGENNYLFNCISYVLRVAELALSCKPIYILVKHVLIEIEIGFMAAELSLACHFYRFLGMGHAQNMHSAAQDIGGPACNYSWCEYFKGFAAIGLRNGCRARCAEVNLGLMRFVRRDYV